MNTEEQKDLVQRQVIDLVIDIATYLNSDILAGYDVSEDGNRLFVYTMSRDEPFMSFNDGVEWLLDFDNNYDADKVNDCLTSLACVLSDLEAGL